MPITKQTIAIIGCNSILGVAIAKGLCSENYRLLLFDDNEDIANQIYDQICKEIEGAEVEVIECQHKASWEADIIFIVNGMNRIDDISKKIVDVATQKIVAGILKNGDRHQLQQFESFFPHSKVIGLIPTKNGSDSVQLLTKHTKALRTVKEMVEHAGLKPILKEM